MLIVLGFGGRFGVGAVEMAAEAHLLQLDAVGGAGGFAPRLGVPSGAIAVSLVERFEGRIGRRPEGSISSSSSRPTERNNNKLI